MQCVKVKKKNSKLLAHGSYTEFKDYGQKDIFKKKMTCRDLYEKRD